MTFLVFPSSPRQLHFLSRLAVISLHGPLPTWLRLPPRARHQFPLSSSAALVRQQRCAALWGLIRLVPAGRFLAPKKTTSALRNNRLINLQRVFAHTLLGISRCWLTSPSSQVSSAIQQSSQFLALFLVPTPST